MFAHLVILFFLYSGTVQVLSLTCDQLPKLPIPSVKTFVAHNPYQFDYVLTPTFECTTRLFVQAARDGGDPTAVDVKGTTAIVHDFGLGLNNSALLNQCDNGVKSVWYFQYINLEDPKGSSYCAYTCNGTALAEYKCASNNNGTNPMETASMKIAKTVPNGEKIHWAKANCPAHHGCLSFYK
ncbi:hypothetical protein CHUAL_005136 [Chamberlinius hualienensis]